MPSPPDTLTGANRPLVAEASDDAEVRGRVRLGRTGLADAANPSLALESRFDLACNAAHALCPAAVGRQDYRPRQRWVVFQVLPHTIGLGPEIWRVLDTAHSKRNLTEYEGHLDLDEGLVRDIVAACQRVTDRLDDLS